MATTVKELMDELKKFNPDAIVYVYADHGQVEIQCDGVFQYTDDTDITYYGEDMSWGWDNKGVQQNIDPNIVTAVCIG